MIKPQVPRNESQRLAALENYDVLDTLPEADFDNITFIASHICKTPIALVSLVDRDRQWFKSHHGLDATETPRDLAFCAHAINRPDETLVVPDAFEDERFHDNPLATDAPNVRFYAGTPLVNPEGHALGTLCVIDHEPRELDDEQMQALEALSKQVVAQLELRRKVAELQTNEQALREARDLAEAAARAKGEFLANMSHEIRTPMNGVIGMTEVLLNTTMSPEQRRYQGLVKESAESLLSVLNDVLDFSKIEAGKLALDPQPFDLREALGDTMQTLGVRAAEKGVELTYHVDPAVPGCVVGDLGRVRQVVVNLVGNAIKFTPEGEVLLEIVEEARSDGRSRLGFRVRDTGVGIPADKLERIFDSFTQAEESTTRRFGGTGLGLSISRQLIECMGGHIAVESEPGVGSTFRFSIAFPVAPDTAPARVGNASVLAGLPVLVVDDNPTNGTILEEMLRHWKMRPTIVASGADALARLGSNDGAAPGSEPPFPLVLMDFMMPGMDGLETARRIASQCGANAPKILLLSSAGPQTADDTRPLPVSASLTKPVKQGDLLEAIVGALGATACTDAVKAAGFEPKPSGMAAMKVLIAEDGRVNQMVARKLLEERGHEVTIVEDGRQALAAIERASFDAVLMDVQMPEMDGYEATAAIREREAGAAGGHHLPIIAMTANAMQGDRDRCLAAGMDDYVAKPIRSEELYARLERYAESLGT